MRRRRSRRRRRLNARSSSRRKRTRRRLRAVPTRSQPGVVSRTARAARRRVEVRASRVPTPSSAPRRRPAARPRAAAAARRSARPASGRPASGRPASGRPIGPRSAPDSAPTRSGAFCGGEAPEEHDRRSVSRGRTRRTRRTRTTRNARGQNGGQNAERTPSSGPRAFPTRRSTRHLEPARRGRRRVFFRRARVGAFRGGGPAARASRREERARRRGEATRGRTRRAPRALRRRRRGDARGGAEETPRDGASVRRATLAGSTRVSARAARGG